MDVRYFAWSKWMRKEAFPYRAIYLERFNYSVSLIDVFNNLFVQFILLNKDVNVMDKSRAFSV